MKSLKKAISVVLCVIMMLSILPMSSIEADAATTYAYPKISALKVPRIYQPSSDTIGMCHFNSIACLIAYEKGSYTYGGLSRTYSYGTDYAYSSDPIWNKMYDDCNECYDPILNNYYTKYPGNIVTETVTGNNTQTYKIIYDQLSKGNPVVVYGSGSPNHASVVIGYSASTNSLDASKFCVMQITKSGNYWPNSKSNFDTYANSPTTSHSKSCYLTLSAWMSYSDITLTRISYYKDPGVEIDKSYKEYSISNTNAVLCGKVTNPKLKSLGNCGIKLYDSSGNLLKECKESISNLSSYSVVNLYYNVNTELKYTLKAGTTYKYQFFAVVNGKTYYSDMETFTTTGGISSYTLSYNANGGSGAPSSQTGSKSYTISSAKPTRDGYTFLGWSTSSSATSASYAPGESITLTQNTTLYAVWKEIPVYNIYELVYDANGGTGAPSSQTFEENEVIYISEEKPVRFGYLFVGWNTMASGNGYWYSPGEQVTLNESLKLYAMWQVVDFTLGSGTILEFGDEFDEIYIRVVPTESKIYVVESESTEYNLDMVGALYDANGTELTSNDDISSEDKNFKFSYYLEAGKTYYIYAKPLNKTIGTAYLYTGEAYSVYFDANGGNGAPDTLTGDYKYIIPDEIPYRDGYKFLGWTTDTNYNYIDKVPGDEIEIIGDCYLYAVWESTSASFTVYYNANGGINAPQAQTVNSDEVGYVPSEEPVRTGYNFIGWCTQSDGTGVWYYSGNMLRTQVDMEDMVLYAIWSKNDTSISVFTMSIRNPSITTISYGDSIVLHADITGTLPEGATIQWFADNGNFEKVASNDGKTCRITPSSSGNTTFTVKVVSADNEVLAEDTQVMTSKAGFFDKIIAFFKGIFGLLTDYPQLFRGILY